MRLLLHLWQGPEVAVATALDAVYMMALAGVAGRSSETIHMAWGKLPAASRTSLVSCFKLASASGCYPIPTITFDSHNKTRWLLPVSLTLS